ncbi:MAG: RnfABCDGE type electron transport complex subunit D [Fibrobacterota bacterium]
MMTDETRIHISSSPHIRQPRDVPAIMKDVAIALIPALAASVIFFGIRSLLITATAVAAAVLTEHLITVHLYKRETSIGDYSAAVTGALLAFNLPVSVPLWLVALGSFFAIAVVKMAFGGLGNNFVNPALAGRAFLLGSYPALTTGSAFLEGGFLGKIPASPGGLSSDAVSSASLDALSAATPLETMGTIPAGYIPEALQNLFFGAVGGCIGEVSAIALLLGGIYLVLRRVISPRIPLTFIGTVFLFNYLFPPVADIPVFSMLNLQYATYQILAGGLILGAVFMATDMVTSPISRKGQFIFALGCGTLTVVIRRFGGYPEGVSYSILLMNLLVPLIDRYVKPAVYGKRVAL